MFNVIHVDKTQPAGFDVLLPALFYPTITPVTYHDQFNITVLDIVLDNEVFV